MKLLCSRLRDPDNFVNSALSRFVSAKASDPQPCSAIDRTLFVLSCRLKIRLQPILYVPNLKGLGHTVLDNFCTDQMIIKLTKISK